MPAPPGSHAVSICARVTAAHFVIGFEAPGIAELLALRPEGSSMIGAILGLTARPLMEALIQFAGASGAKEALLLANPYDPEIR